MSYIQGIKWLMLIAHFPVSMSASIFGGMLLGLIRKRPIGNIAAAVGLLSIGPVASLVLWSWLLFVLSVCRLLFLSYASYMVLLPAWAVFLNLSRTALIGSSDARLRPRPKHWSSHFLRTILIVGLPCGLALGITLGVLLHDMYWILTPSK